MKKLFLYFKSILIVVITILIFGIIFILNPIIVDKSNEITLIANEKFTVKEIKQGLLSVEYKLDNYGVVLITNELNNGHEYKYIMRKGIDTIALTNGAGTYNIVVHEAVKNSDGSADIIDTYDNIKVNLTENNKDIVFTYSTTLIDFENNKDIINKEFKDINNIDEIYEYFKDMSYNHSLADDIASGNITEYKVDISKTLNTKQGICFDLATSMTAVLRSKGYKAKMVYGYAGDTYHSWVSVLIDNNWVDFDPTIGRTSYENSMSNYIIDEYH